MQESDLVDLLDGALREGGRRLGAGVESNFFEMEIVRFYTRGVWLYPIPWIGQSLSIVALARQPNDLSMTPMHQRTLLDRVARVISARYPPWRGGASLALTCIVIGREILQPDDEAQLQALLVAIPRFRCVPLGVIRVNLEQETMVMALRRGPLGLYPEPDLVADALAARLRRFLAPIQFDGASPSQA